MKMKVFAHRTVGLLAVCVPFWFVLIYLSLSQLRPDYSHLTKAISELGSVDAPHRWVWNIGGFIVPGAIVAMLGLSISNQLQGERGIRLASSGLVASGLLMGLSGVFPGNFEDRSSMTMVMHAIGSLGSFVGFLICGFVLPTVLRRVSTWSAYAWPSLTLVILSLATGFLRFGNTPGLGQRLGIACFFLWIGLIGFASFRNATLKVERSG